VPSTKSRRSRSTLDSQRAAARVPQMRPWLVVGGVALLAVAVIVYAAFTFGPLAKRCVQPASDVRFSYNGGCEDPNVPVERESDFGPGLETE
jgi:hypothetical protein